MNTESQTLSDAIDTVKNVRESRSKRLDATRVIADYKSENKIEVIEGPSQHYFCPNCPESDDQTCNTKPDHYQALHA